MGEFFKEQKVTSVERRKTDIFKLVKYDQKEMEIERKKRKKEYKKESKTEKRKKERMKEKLWHYLKR